MKLDFSKAKDIVEVIQTCPLCHGMKVYGGFICKECGGSGRTVSFMTPHALKELLTLIDDQGGNEL